MHFAPFLDSTAAVKPDLRVLILLETRMNKWPERAGVPSDAVHLTRIIPGVLIISLWGPVNQVVAGRDYLGSQVTGCKSVNSRHRPLAIAQKAQCLRAF
jgi:hypothetical protein